MTRKILFVDDEAMSLKYFERLVSPLAPVLTAPSVAEGKVLLDRHAGEVGVLVSDQRMPGAQGNELLRYARERHPHVVRMLTTAYSELGDAIEAINSGEIFRYVTKPWDMPALQADLRSALELAALRAERDTLLREKLSVQRQQLLGQRAGQLAVACAAASPQADASLALYLRIAAQTGCPAPDIDWHAMGYPELVAAEAQRATAIAGHLAHWRSRFNGTPQDALAALAAALGSPTPATGAALEVTQPAPFTGLLSQPAGQLPAAQDAAWLAWLLAWGHGAVVTPCSSGWEVRHDAAAAMPPLPGDWLSVGVERLLEGAREP